MRVDVALPRVLQTQVVHPQDLVKDVLDVDSTTGVVWSVGETTLLSHEVRQGVVSVRSVPEYQLLILLLDNVSSPLREER